MSNIFYKKYKRLSGREVVDHIENFFEAQESPLTEYQKRKLINYWGEDMGMYGDLRLPFQAYTWKRVNYEGDSLVRLTFPLLVIVIILITFAVRPIHWLLTGSWWFKGGENSRSKIEDFLNKWWVGIFGE